MFNFFNIEMNRIAAAAVAALVLSTACVGAAVGPARSAETDRTTILAEANAVSGKASA